MNSDKIQKSELLQRICGPLLDWYDSNSRELEWRKHPLPYYVWISEVMLQQTRVEAVKPYFARFIKELPDIESLASCPEDKLLKLWEGLGYYSRVRNLQKAAKVVMESYSGQLPADEAALRSLPGIGSYTAGAIASIACGICAPAVDGNVLRVLSRIDARDNCIDDPKVKKCFEDEIRFFLECNRGNVSPGKLNQALMELGALVCLPNGDPDCTICPVRDMCVSRRENLTGLIPVRKRKKARRIEERTVLVIRDATQTVIRKRPAGGILAGLWELPNMEGHLTQEEALTAAKELGVYALRITGLPEAKHVFSHVEWHMTGYLILAQELDPDALAGGCIAITPSQAQRNYSIPSAFSRYTRYLDILTGRENVIESNL